ncbi:MAG: TIGR02300 family protein [Alphaproteobacteria bacterium]|nr:TIGR02300 family protein [Alphaproteobacteria bacterium]
MAKAEWGLKRTCQSCGARFYDLQRSPTVCPKCEAEYDPEVLLKSRRGKPAAVAAVVPKPVVDPVEADEVVAEDEEEEEEDDTVMEDTSELGEDAEDVAEVVEKADDEER